MNAQLLQVVAESFPASRKVYRAGTPAPGPARADARDRPAPGRRRSRR